MTTEPRANDRRALAAVVAVIVVVVGVGIGLAVTHSPAPSKAIGPSGCQPDPSAQIAALPSGGTFTGTGCYNVPNGVSLTQPVTITGGTWNDMTTTPPPQPAHGKIGPNPVFRIRNTHDVTLSNLAIVGANAKGHYSAGMVGAAGIDVQSSANITITSVTTTNTFGDGLTLAWDGRNGTTSNVQVDHLTITNAGRQGITPAEVAGARFSYVTINGAADSGVDFESDVPTVGSSNVVFDHLTTRPGINIIEQVAGLTFTNSAMTGRLMSQAAQVSYQGSITCERRAPGACVTVPAGNLTFVPPTIFSRVPGHSTITEPYTQAVPPGTITGTVPA